MQRKRILTLGAGLLVLAAVAWATDPIETIILLCDNQTELVIPGLKPGTSLNHEQAFQVAEKFMDVWEEKNPGSNWIMAQNYGPKNLAMQVRTKGSAGGDQTGIYSGFTATDEFVWRTEYEQFVAEGNHIFHDAEAFGGTVGVSL